MHELSLCESVLQVLQEQARSQGFERVRRVRLEVGALAGVEVEAMRFGFDVVTRGSLAEGAELVILERSATAFCLDCGRTVEVAQRFDPCPLCGGVHLQVTGGEELRIKDLEVE
jgi:hydrogenase nickel incorporation protein HypA/HybF